MKVEEIEINKIIPYANNPRHNDQAVSAVAASIKEFGFRQPIVTDETMTILVGHTRLKAAQNLGLSVVPVHIAEGLTDTQKKAYRIADNRLNELAEWDNELLSLELEALTEADFDIGLLGFSDEELDELLDSGADTEGNTDPDDVPEVPENPVTELGDIWLLGEHRLMCGDSRKISEVGRLVNDYEVDIVFSDPPYGVSIVGVKQNNKEVGGNAVVGFGKVGGNAVVAAKDYAEIIGDDTTETAREFYNTCVAAGFDSFIIWGGNYFTDFLPPSSCWLVWDKQNSGNFADVELAWCSYGRAAKLYSFTWNGMSRQGDRKTELATRVHPTQKPVGMFCEIMRDFEFTSCFDGFLGSGSTLIACEKMSRVCYGMEMSRQYCDVILKRWQDFTGKKAILERTGEEFDTLCASISEETVIK